MKTKKLLIILLICMLALNILFITKVKANSEVQAEESNIENVEQENVNEEALLYMQESQPIYVKAKVLEVGEPYIEEVSTYQIKYQDVKVEIKEGEFKGEVLDAKYTVSYDLEGKIEGYLLDKGNIVEIEVQLTDGKINYEEEAVVHGIDRSGYIILLFILLLVISLVVGKVQGLKAIISFIITILAIFLFMLPQIINGHDAIFITILTSVIVTIVSFIIIAGIKKKSIAAMIGTSGGIICAGIVALIFGILAKLSGGQEEAMYLSMNSQNIAFDFKDLLFSGIVIASLGAAMDVGMSIASALDELKQKNPNMLAKDLFKSGMNIGADVIGTMTNTLILAYVGGALNTVLLFMVNNVPLGEILNIEMIATDVISALAASIGVIFSVPITALAYAILNNKKLIYNRRSKNLKEGKRSLDL